MAVRSAARLSLWLLLLSCTRAIVHHRLPLGAHRASLPSLYRVPPPRCAADFDATPGKETVAARCVAERLQKIRAAPVIEFKPAEEKKKKKKSFGGKGGPSGNKFKGVKNAKRATALKN